MGQELRLTLQSSLCVCVCVCVRVRMHCAHVYEHACT